MTLTLTPTPNLYIYNPYWISVEAMAGDVDVELPLWRIHYFSSNSTGDTISVTNISRSDTVALLKELSGGHGPIWAAGKIAFAANYSTNLSTLTEATLVRIKAVSADDKPGVYNAQLLVLCQARVLEISTRGPFPTARRGQDLAPLWRIHNFGIVGDPSFDTMRTEHTIVNITRDDTLALLRKLGGGDVKSAKGHLVLACDYKATVTKGSRAVLVRIGDVSCAEAEGRPPYNCTMKILGHVKCADVELGAPYPQILLDEVPVWRINNLNTTSGSEHALVNIARPDSVALLAHLGQGNPLSATGGLVIGCDYTALPRVGESGRLMRVASISRSTGIGIYEAVLRDVSTISVGTYRSCEGKPADWWPRMTVLLPKIWSKPTEVAKPVERPISSPKAGSCQYWQRCQSALLGVFREAGINFDNKKHYEQAGDRCFCIDCHRRRGDNMTYTRGGQTYILPVGFARIGIKPNKTPHVVEKGMANWHVCYHSTKHQYLSDIIMHGQLLAPGSTLINGDSIKVRDGHIQTSLSRRNECTGEIETFNPTNRIFFSPSIKYCDLEVYVNDYPCNGRRYRFALQLRIQPNTYSVGQETVGAKQTIDPHVPNSSIEWYTEELHTHFFTGILIKEV